MIPHHWRRTPADNGLSDPNADVRPGRFANTLLGAIRGLMATGAAARDDAIGELVAVLGANNAYAAYSNEGLIDIQTGINNVPKAITAPFLLRLSFDTTLAGSATNVPHLTVDGFDCGPILRRDGSALADGDLVKGIPVLLLGEMAAATDTKVTQVRLLDLTPGEIKALAPSGVPMGTIIYMPCGGSVLPTGYLLANGALISRTTYAALWAYVQATSFNVTEADWPNNPAAFSQGDGATTFRLPDLRGVFLRGLDLGRGIDPNRSAAQIQAGQIQSHQHQTVTDGGLLFLGGGVQYFQNGIGQASYASQFATGFAGGSETRPINAAYPALIRAY
ncbi:phage tail protein [Methylobacterium sp. 1973]|uniref:phage tail protein n=1 Tax=Methylobacterium sp. 1973 TaxID=3156421 RepID=UPI003393F7F9